MANSVSNKIDDLFLQLCSKECSYSHFCGYCSALLHFDHIGVSAYLFITDAAYFVDESF